MRATLETKLCPYRSGDGLYGYLILNTYTSDFSHVLICRGPEGEKVVLKTPSDTADYDYFRREVRWWQALTANPRHAVNLVRCTAFIRLELKPFAVLEYVNGPDLRTLLGHSPNRQIAISQALLFGIQFCLGMIAADTQAASHERKARGFAHRDICPDNIMVSCLTAADAGRNTLKIADFGLARALTAEDASGHGSTRFTGRPDYAAPEVFRGSHRTTAASDVYSFGVTLWEMLTGLVPHPIRRHEALDDFRRRLRQQPSLRLRDHRPEAPDQLDGILAGCLRQREQSRYPDFSTLLDDLRAVAAAVFQGSGIPGEDRQCRACSYIIHRTPENGQCPLCGSNWQSTAIVVPQF